MQQKEAEIVSVFVWSKLKAFICHNLKALCIRKEIKSLIKAFHRGITLHSIWTYDKVRGLLIIKLCPPDSEQNGHQAKMTTEISTQNLYNPKSYNVLSHVKVSWRHFFFKSIQCTQIRIQLQKSFWYVIVWYEPPVIPFFTRHQMLWNVMGMVNPNRFEKKAQSIKSTYHWILVMFSLNPRIPLVSFVSNTCWLLWYIQLNFKYPYSITVSWELRDSLHA